MESRASLDGLAKIVTAFIFVVTIFLIYMTWQAEGVAATASTGAGVVVLVAVILYCYLYSVKSYRIENKHLVVQRLMGSKKWDLRLLKTVEGYEQTKSGISLRTFGNGGLFGYFGHFYNVGIGSFKIYATNHKKLWILTFANTKVAISPDDPVFIRKLREESPTVA